MDSNDFHLAYDSMDVDEEPPILDHSSGSREIVRVSETVQALYKVVRCGNVAFSSGNVKDAYTVLHEALRLFKHFHNEKSIGVVNNNLGNVMLIMYRTMENFHMQRLNGKAKADIIREGITFYQQAIELGEKEYDDIQGENSAPLKCLEFLQHLSNRYFNRGVFLLTVKDCHSQPDEIEQLGLRDIEIARDLDQEIADSGEEAGWTRMECIEKFLNIVEIRSRGYLLLLELGYPDDWEVDELLDDAFRMLKKEINDDCSALFDTVTVVGRLQRIEAELIQYKLLKGAWKEAAQIGIRMLMEDEYISLEAQSWAQESLSMYVPVMEVDPGTRRELKEGLSVFQNDLQSAIKAMEETLAPTRSEKLYTLSDRRKSDMKVASELFQMSSAREFRRGYVSMEEL